MVQISKEFINIAITIATLESTATLDNLAVS